MEDRLLKTWADRSFQMRGNPQWMIYISPNEEKNREIEYFCSLS